MKSKAKSNKKAAAKKPLNRTMAGLAVALLCTLGALGLQLKDRYLPKYKAGQCLASKTTPEAFIIQGVENGRYKGIQVAILFGFALDVPVAVLNNRDGLIEINCETGEPVK